MLPNILKIHTRALICITDWINSSSSSSSSDDTGQWQQLQSRTWKFKIVIDPRAHLQFPLWRPWSVFTVLTPCISIIHTLNMHISTHIHLVHMSVILQPGRRISRVSSVRMRSVESTGAPQTPQYQHQTLTGSTVSWWEPRTGYRDTSTLHTYYSTGSLLTWRCYIINSDYIQWM